MPITTRLLDGKAGTTQTVASTDTAQSLPAAVIKDTNLGIANGAIISVETNTIRYTFTSTPTQAGLGHACTAGNGLVLNSPQMVKNFKFISASAGSHANLQITPII